MAENPVPLEDLNLVERMLQREILYKLVAEDSFKIRFRENLDNSPYNIWTCLPKTSLKEP